MGWSMDWSKDFISFWKLAKKKNNLINWSILPRFPPPAQLNYPQNNRIVLPLRPPSFTHPIPSLVRRCRSFFVDCCVVYDVLQPFNAATNFYFCLFLLLSLSPQTKLKRPPNTFHRGRAPAPMSSTLKTPTFGWLLCPFIEWRQPTAMAPSSSLIIFVELIRRPNRRYGVPPHVPPLPRVLPDSPPSSKPTYNWLLCVILQNGGHPKAQASSLFALFFDPSHFAPPKREPTTANASPMAHGLRMALGSGGAMIWWRRWSIHEERTKSRWVAAARVWLLCWFTLFCDFSDSIIWYWYMMYENLRIRTWSTMKYLRYTHKHTAL